MTQCKQDGSAGMTGADFLEEGRLTLGRRGLLAREEAARP